MSDTLPHRLERVMREAGYNPRSLSLSASLGETAVRDIVEGRIASPRYSTLRALANVLHVEVDYLVGGHKSVTASSNGHTAVENGEAGSRNGSPVGHELPVYGVAQNSCDDIVISSEPMQRVSEPLLTVAGGYGVFVMGESMCPAYDQGDIALVHPALPPRRDTDVMLTRTAADGTRHILIRRLLGWTDENWRVRQYNPSTEIELPRADWRSVQTIVGKYHGR